MKQNDWSHISTVGKETDLYSVGLQFEYHLNLLNLQVFHVR
jgi:hypothetical protein